MKVVQHFIALRTMRAYKSLSYEVISVLTAMLPINMQVFERASIHRVKRERTGHEAIKGLEQS